MPDEELVDIYDDTGKLVGSATRTEADERNLIYPNAIIFVFSTDGKVWVQKRSLAKRHYPGLWDPTACGAIEHGEDPKVAARRELKEEMNLDCELTLAETFLNSMLSEDGTITRTRLSHIFIGSSDEQPTSNHEVEAIAAFDTEELLQELQTRPEEFVPSFEVELRKALKAREK